MLGEEAMLIWFWGSPVVKVETITLVVLLARQNCKLALVREKEEMGTAGMAVTLVRTSTLLARAKVLVPPPIVVNGVEPRRFNVPFWLPDANVRIGPNNGTVTNTTLPPTLAEPELRAKAP